MAGATEPSSTGHAVARGFPWWASPIRLAAVLRDRVGAAWMRGRLTKELERLDDQALADLGVNREQIPALVEGIPDAPRLMARMMARRGIDARRLGRQLDLAHELELACATCGSRRLCRQWLDAPSPPDGYREFCPNVALMDKLAGNGA